MPESKPLVAVIMGSKSDWDTMRNAVETLDELGVPIQSKLQGLDSLLSTAQMPGGTPVGTLAIGEAGAKNAALLAASILATSDDTIRQELEALRRKQSEAVLAAKLPT